MKTYETNLIERAIDYGYEMNDESRMQTLQDIIDECESIITNEIDYDRMERCELWRNGGEQHYTWSDGKGKCIDMSGDIFADFDAVASDEVYFHKVGNKFTPVSWADIPDDECRDEYVFLFAKHIDTDAQIVALYDFVK